MNFRRWLTAFLLLSTPAFADSSIRCHWNSDQAGDLLLNTYTGSATLAVDIYTTDFAALGMNVPNAAYYARVYLSPVETSAISTADPLQANISAPSHLIEFLDGGERSLGFQDNFQLQVQLKTVRQNDALTYELDLVRNNGKKAHTTFQYRLGTQIDQATCHAS